MFLFHFKTHYNVGINEIRNPETLVMKIIIVFVTQH